MTWLRWILMKLGYVYWQKPVNTNPYEWKKIPWVITGNINDPCGCKRTRFRKYLMKRPTRFGMYYSLIDEFEDIGNANFLFVFKFYGQDKTAGAKPHHMKEFLRVTNKGCKHSPAALVNWSPKK